MNNNARYLLRNALHEHGIDIIHDAVRLQAVLNNYAQDQFKTEIYLWVLSATDNIPDTLLKNNSDPFPLPFNVLIAKLSIQLHENFRIDKASAMWTIDSWIFALNLTVALSLVPIIDSNFKSGREVKSLINIEQTTEKLAVLFADICGSTSLYDNIGDDLARHFTANCIKTMSSQIAPYKGTLIKTIGDEIMCTFPDAKAALNAACAMQNAVKNSREDSKQPLSIRIGFHYGVVICEADDVFGDTVNVAARVAGIAKTDQIMTTAATFAALPATLQNQTRPFKSTNLKGKQDQCEIYWVLWQENNEVQPLPPTSHYDTHSSTQVILKYIPKNTTYKQILQFIKPALKGGIFSKPGKIDRISVLAQKKEPSNATEFHAILSIQPDEAAKRIINKLHRKQLNGHYIAVAEYIERSIHNNRSNTYTKGTYPEGNHFIECRDTTKRFRLITIEQLKNFNWTENTEA
ncbi:MAG: adenylate/guanylate cyclase domain-containing protein [Methylococcales bacterium]|nr:adenylate/guanylate cyclase domain-containing protein [Methylococcales bacterium]